MGSADRPTTEASGERAEGGGAATRRRFPARDEEAGEMVECSGGACRSCTAVFIADCVSVCCCCPCAVVSLLGLAFLKVPWMLGRRCLRLVKKKMGSPEKKGGDKTGGGKGVRRERGVKSPVREDGGISGIGDGEGGGENMFAGFEADRVWLELYQLGHWGFGRVSVSGVSGKGV